LRPVGPPALFTLTFAGHVAPDDDMNDDPTLQGCLGARLVIAALTGPER